MLVAQDDLFSPKRFASPVTVLDAIGDLPPIRSGETANAYDHEPFHSYQRERRSGSRALKLHASTAHTPNMLEIIKHSGKNISFIPKHLISSGSSIRCPPGSASCKPCARITACRNAAHPRRWAMSAR
jgi:DNA (cytosine-5)-methyltransferase 1